MPSLTLKEYQRESLDAIGGFCDHVRHFVGTKAMRPVHDAYYTATGGREYIEVPQMPGVPYACLRVPTGGGKTLIAAHAIGVMAKRLGHQDRPLCLWVTPSTTIRDQTLNGLRNREHPYHEALRESLGVPVEVLTVEEALAANRAMMSSSAVIVVTTIQSYRIDDEGNRRIYQDNGYLMDHFANLPAYMREQLAEPETGRVSLSLANVMKLRGPIVIMDEAHNARTRISFDSLQRFGPLAVLELTATPQQDHDPDRDEYASNVLHAVSALQLKREGMIKLPIELESRDNWLDVLATAKDHRDSLEERAKAWGQQSGRFIRPIALIQAQPKSKTRETHTVDAVKDALLKMNIAPERIRIATGDKDDLGNEDLRAPGCTVEYIITVDKLREGWDCPFAYVLGSVGNVATETAVEQLLGRVMRMPGAVPTGVPELDRAYAIVQSQDVMQTAKSLCESLVSRCGFDSESVGDAFRVHRRVDPQGQLPISIIPISAPPKMEQLSAAVQEKISYDAKLAILNVQVPLTHEETLQLHNAFESLMDRVAVQEYWQQERTVGTAAKQLHEYAAPVRVPQLAVRDGERCYLFEPEELDEFAWDLNQCDPKISEAELSVALNVGDRVAVGLAERGGVRIGTVEEIIIRQLSFVGEGDDWSSLELVRWLNSELHRGDKARGLTAAEGQAWLARVVDHLLTERGADLRVLVRKRHDLANVVIRRIVEHGRHQVRLAAQMLIQDRSPRQLETSPDVVFLIAEQEYGPYKQYRGRYDYPKHAFSLIAAMGDEEGDCAKRIDDHVDVKRWVRNLDRESAGGFSLPLSPGRFFPDFVAELNDGRIAIVEYKGKHLAHSPDELHKKTAGELWAERSGGRCVFVWVVDKDWQTLESKLATM